MEKNMEKGLTGRHSTNTEVISITINSTLTATYHTKMEINSKVHLKMASVMETGHTLGLMGLTIKDPINMIKNKDKENINLSSRFIGRENG